MMLCLWHCERSRNDFFAVIFAMFGIQGLEPRHGFQDIVLERIIDFHKLLQFDSSLFHDLVFDIEMIQKHLGQVPFINGHRRLLGCGHQRRAAASRGRCGTLAMEDKLNRRENHGLVKKVRNERAEGKRQHLFYGVGLPPREKMCTWQAASLERGMKANISASQK